MAIERCHNSSLLIVITLYVHVCVSVVAGDASWRLHCNVLLLITAASHIQAVSGHILCNHQRQSTKHQVSAASSGEKQCQVGKRRIVWWLLHAGFRHAYGIPV